MTPFDYEFLRKLIKERSGLALTSDKRYLVESRLMPLARRAGMADISSLVLRLRAGDAALAAQTVEAMATNETFFFRDKTPFTHLRDVLIPGLMRTRAARRRIRIWCAACSTGQESYSLAMTVREMADTLAGWKVDIVATDFSHDVLERAVSGTYSQFEVQRGLPIQMLIKYFNQVGEMWQVSPLLRGMVRYQPFNLLDDPSRLGMFDLVFCRNVLIYLDGGTKSGVLERLSRVTEAGGALVLGAAETVVGLSDAWRPDPDQRGVFIPTRPRASSPRLVTAAGRG